MEDREWKEVRNRNHRSVFDRLGAKNQVCDDTLNVYVSNFPSHLTKRELWVICGKMGKLIDVYIARNKNKLGQMFAFCRYDAVQNHETLIEGLKNTWIGSFHLHANIARFEKNQKMNMGHTKDDSVKQVKHVKVAMNDNRGSRVSQATWTPNGNKSYVSIVKGKAEESDKVDCIKDDMEENVPISMGDSSNLARAVFGEFKEFLSIENARIICKNEGFQDVETYYLGGFWVLFQFKEVQSYSKFLVNEGVKSWFQSLEPWRNDFVVAERLIWLEIEGVPVLAWNADTFKSLCNRWGDMVFVDDTDKYNKLGKRVCVKSRHMELIFQSITATLNDVNHTVRVRELCSWTPSFSVEEEDEVGDESLGDNEDLVQNSEPDDDVSLEPDDEADAKRVNGLTDNHGDQNEVFISTPSDPFGLNSLIFDVPKVVNETGDKSGYDSATGCDKDGLGGDESHVEFVDDGEEEGEFHANFVGSKGHSEMAVAKGGISIEKKVEDTIKVGRVLGFEMANDDHTIAKMAPELGDAKGFMSNKVEDEILGDHFESAPAKDPNIVSPSTPVGNDLNITDESGFTWLDYVGPLISGKIDCEKCWSYRDPKGNVHGLFSLAQLRLWKNYFPSDLHITMAMIKKLSFFKTP